MKKSKKVLLWSIVPVLGVSSGVAGAVAGTKDQTTSVGTNNVATSSSATTMAARNTSSNLKIESQSYNVTSFSGEQNTIYVHVSGGSSKVRYEWMVNKGEKWETYTRGLGAAATMVTSPKTTSVVDWTFKCKIVDLTTGKSITSDFVKFTTLPTDGRYIKINNQPEAKMTVDGGEKFTLKTKAEVVGKTHIGKEIGYQWFEYNSENNSFVKVEGADSNEYTFTAEHVKEQKVKKYVCKYYFKNKPGVYLNESDQSIVTINKSEKEVISVESLKASESSIKVGQSTLLSVKATSTKTKDLKYQWYKASDSNLSFTMIDGANTENYVYEATKEDANKKLTFMVLITGIQQYGTINHLQSENLEVNVAASETVVESIDKDNFVNNLKVDSKVLNNQASVKSTFYPNTKVNNSWYSVDVKGVQDTSGLSYKWYYVGRNGNKHLIQDATTNGLTPTKNLFEAAYKDNSNHKVGIMCEIYNNGQLVKTIDQKTNDRFYMNVVINNRRVSNI